MRTPTLLRSSCVRLVVSAAALLGLTAACSEAPSAPHTALAPGAAPARLISSTVKSQALLGDTVVTVFVVGTNTATGSTFEIGHSSKIDFPYNSNSICDPLTASYGPGTWDQKCTATKLPTQITARVWKDANGFVHTDFQPALRFVPGLKKTVLLRLKDDHLALAPRIDFCTSTGCIDEAATDPSVQTYLDSVNGFAYRTIKHFSGYNVVVDRSEEDTSFDGGY